MCAIRAWSGLAIRGDLEAHGGRPLLMTVETLCCATVPSRSPRISAFGWPFRRLPGVAGVDPTARGSQRTYTDRVAEAVHEHKHVHWILVRRRRRRFAPAPRTR